MSNPVKGTLYGIGVGPGDPELVTLKAARLIQQAAVLVYLSNDQGQSQSRTIVASLIDQRSVAAVEVPVVMPMCDDRNVANRVYDESAEKISTHLNEGQDVVFLCEGDPLFFGSFTYLLERLETRFRCHTVPGIASPQAAASLLNLPLTQLNQSLAIVSGRHSETQLIDALRSHDCVVIMKAGKSRPKILRALQLAERAQDARYLEYMYRDNQIIVHDIASLTVESGPYFSLFLVQRPHGGGE